MLCLISWNLLKQQKNIKYYKYITFNIFSCLLLTKNVIIGKICKIKASCYTCKDKTNTKEEKDMFIVQNLETVAGVHTHTHTHTHTHKYFK